VLWGCWVVGLGAWDGGGEGEGGEEEGVIAGYATVESSERENQAGASISTTIPQ
jgi:hypothetical protein